MNTPIPIIVVNYREYADRFLADFYASLGKVQDIPWELVVIDNESTAATQARIRSLAPEAKIIPLSHNYGYAAYSYVIDDFIREGYDRVLISNMDVEVTPDFLSKLSAVLDSSEDIVAVQPRIMLFDEKEKINSVGNIIHFAGFGYSVGGYDAWEHYKKILTQPQQICYGSGASLLIKTSIIKEIGLFDKDFFMYHEDLDLGWRILLAGKKTVLVPDAVVYHKYEFAKSVRQYFWMERNRFICLFKNYKILSLLVFFPPLLFLECGLLLFSIFSGFFTEKLRVYATFLKPATWSRIKKGRAQVQAMRRVSDKEVLRWFTGRIEAQQVQNPILTYIVNPITQLYLGAVTILFFW